MRIDETNYAIIDRAEKLLFTDYEKRWYDAENIDGYIEEETLLDIIDDLCSEIDRLQEQLEEQKEKHEEEIKEFYKPRSKYEMYGINENAFH